MDTDELTAAIIAELVEVLAEVVGHWTGACATRTLPTQALVKARILIQRYQSDPVPGQGRVGGGGCIS